MQLTPAQTATLKAFILADPVIGPKATAGDYDAVAAGLNAIVSPAYFVYRSSVPLSEIMLNGFDWTRVDNLSVGKARIWEWMFSADAIGRTINPSKLNIQAGINAVWVGTQADLDVRAAVYVHCNRSATVAEKVLKTAGSGTAITSTGTGPATMGAEGLVDVGQIGGILA